MRPAGRYRRRRGNGLASVLVAENEGQGMALASKTALIGRHLLRDQREGRPRSRNVDAEAPRQDRASQCDLIVGGAILLFNVNS
jgi:hypothetical protein